MPGDVFPNIDRIGHIQSPIFIIHGTRDEVVPFWHGQELFLACQKRLVFVALVPPSLYNEHTD